MLRICLFLALVGYCVTPSIAQIGAMRSNTTGSPVFHHKRQSPPSAIASGRSPQALGTTVRLGYYDPEKDSIHMPLAASLPPVIVVSMAERFTLPTQAGFLDSIRIWAYLESGESFNIDLLPVSALEDNFGRAFLVMDPEQPALGTVTVFAEDINPDGWTTVMFNHVQVPKDFAVAISPAAGLTSIVRVGMDLTTLGLLDPTTSRTSMVYYSDGSFYRSWFDSSFFFYKTGNDPVFSNLYLEAFVDVELSTVKEEHAAIISIAPNPATGTSVISGLKGGERVLLIDPLGRTVYEDIVSEDHLDINVRGLPSGSYFLRTSTGRNGKITIGR